MDNYQKLYDEEKGKYERLKAEMDKHYRLMKILQEFVPSEVESEKSVSDSKEPRYLQEDSKFLLKTIAKEPKKLDDLVAALGNAGFKLSRTTIASRVGFQKREYGFIDSPEEGVYKLSAKGRDFLERKYPDVLKDNAERNTEGGEPAKKE